MSERRSSEVLSNGDVVLHLEETCIQTTAKKAHRELVTLCIEQGETDAGIEAAVELLCDFLQTTDFARVRSEHPELAGGTACSVRLIRGGEGKVDWEVVTPP